MINSLSLVLVIVAAVTLALGWFQDRLALVHVSIATCLVALALLGVDRLLRRRAPVPSPAVQTATPGSQTGTPGSQTGTPGSQTGTPGSQTAVLAGATAVREGPRSSTAVAAPVAAPSTARSVSELEQVRGLGPAKRGALLDRFGTVEAIAAASPDELRRTPGIGAGLARAIADQLS